jgi:F-type H+-transporting ATPase subunit a
LKEKSRGRTIFLIVWLALIVLLLAAVFLVGLPQGHAESIKDVMRDGVLHDENRIAVFGLRVNPGLISAWVMTVVLLIAAACLRIFAIPKFKEVPGKFQSVIEALVEFFSGLAKGNSPHKPGFVGAYIFAAGVYIFFSTLFELVGARVMTDAGVTVSLPAPIADINGALGMGVLSYLMILAAGFVHNGVRGGLGVLKDFSLPISMSFRLFGALLSGLLVTELVYYNVALSFVLPVLVGVLFTLMHAAIQTYVLASLVSFFYGEAVEPKPPKVPKAKREKKPKKA